LVFFLLLFGLPHVFASDDSNSSNLSVQQNVNPQALSSTLSILAQGLNDSQTKQLVNQLSTELKNGNTSAAAATLQQLQNAARSGAGQNMSGALKALVQSIQVSKNGTTVNANELASTLGVSNSTSSGVPSSLANQNPEASVQDLQALANLLKYVDPTLADQLASQAGQIEQNQSSSIPAPAPISLPSTGAGGFSAPSINPPALTVPPIQDLPEVNPVLFAAPVIVVLAAALIFASRRRFVGTAATQLRGSETSSELVEQYDGRDAKKRIMFYFSKAVRLMENRGMGKDRSETHREFSSRFNGRVEQPHISRVSELYEKAKFSGDAVVTSEADEAQAELSLLERTRIET
jgi:hypothetical protein